MNVSVSAGTGKGHRAEVVAFAVFEGEPTRGGALRGAEDLIGAPIAGLFEAAGFKGDAERVLVHHRVAKSGPRRVVFVGLGRAGATEESWRRAGAHAARASGEMTSLAFVAPKDKAPPASIAAAVIEGASLVRYRFDRFQTKPKRAPPGLAALTLVVPDAASARAASAGVAIGLANAAGVAFARDLANTPGNECRPADLAAHARRMAKDEGVSCAVLDEPALRKLKMGSLLSVNGGSVGPPRLIVLELGKKRPRVPTVCVIGKGITFDSGGISIKPALDMDKMRYDKSGGCATIGLMLAMARLRPNVHLVGIVPACENMPGGDATRPGDVVRAMNGKTIEVLNTDAEGRLVLADAICYARQRFKPDLIVDMATLTGACAATFGPHASGMLGNDPAAMRDLEAAGDATYERVWQLPLYEEYETLIRGTYGDLKNIGGPKGGTITAAAFLKQFVEATPWVHLDIAGTAYDDSARVYNQGTGATGVGVRLLSRFLLDRYAETSNRA